MFVSRSRYEAEINSLKQLQHIQEAYCFERIRQLEGHLEDLRKLVFTPASTLPTPEMREVDEVLTPTNDAPIFAPSLEQDDIMREQNRIFSGEYETAEDLT